MKCLAIKLIETANLVPYRKSFRDGHVNVKNDDARFNSWGHSDRIAWIT